MPGYIIPPPRFRGHKTSPNPSWSSLHYPSRPVSGSDLLLQWIPWGRAGLATVVTGQAGEGSPAANISPHLDLGNSQWIGCQSSKFCSSPDSWTFGTTSSSPRRPSAVSLQRLWRPDWIRRLNQCGISRLCTRCYWFGPRKWETDRRDMPPE